MSLTYYNQKRLALGLHTMPDWSNYVISTENALVVKHLKSLQPGEQILLLGHPGSGCSHITQALCLQQSSQPSFYYHLAPTRPLQYPMLEGLSQSRLVCVENLALIAHDREQQILFFEMINLCLRHTISMVITAKQGPEFFDHPWLADLKTRFQAMVTHSVVPLIDEEKKQAIQLWYSAQSIQLDIQLIDYLLNQYSRDLSLIKYTLDKYIKFCESSRIKLNINNLKHFLRTN